MAFNFSESISRGRERIAATSPSKLIIGGLLLLLATAAFIYFLVYNNRTSYDVLYSELSPEDAGAITAELKKEDVSYQLSDGGAVIEVPSDVVHDTRLNLAMKGLPAKSGVGFEIFDDHQLGVTDMEQKIKLQRAVTGELERTIMRFPEVTDARIHLTVPRETLFIEDQKEPTASVVLTLKRGATLDKSKIMGIVHLITSAVDGLTPDNVSVIDTEGGLLWSKDSQRPGLLNDEQLKQKRAFERDLQARINSMLERVLGPYKATTQVNVELDLKEVVTNEDFYDPEGSVVRSEQRIQERETGPGRANAGIPNATYELGTANRQNSGQNDNVVTYTSSEETTNYEVSNTKRQTVSASGDLKKVTVAVIVDGFFTENEAGEQIFTPLPAEQIAQLTEAIKNTIGFDEKRGDSVSVTCLEFYREENVSVWALFVLDLLREFGRPLINLLLIILFFIFVIRPILNWLKKEVEPAGSGAEQAVLPDYPVTGPPGGDSLPLPLPPSGTGDYSQSEVYPMGSGVGGGPGSTTSRQTGLSEARPGDAADEGEEEDYESDDTDTSQYDYEEPEDVDVPQRLEYGKLTRENILPLARDNMDRTIGLLRKWIEQKPTDSQPEK
ncbi:MAG: flagellar M-ring protein FliF [Deltaproteobacteria bacterium]|jgi:flagellar M-ring protein FliF|nr:flagellar M-ring protein FliF [Deltaproteobacteria bacterium]